MNQWCDPRRSTGKLFTGKQKDMKYFWGTNGGREHTWGSDWMDTRRDTPATSVISPTCQQFSTPVPQSFHFRRCYSHKENNQPYVSGLVDVSLTGWTALENPTLSPTGKRPQVVISNKMCFHWFFFFLWIQTKAATTPPTPSLPTPQKSFRPAVVAV